MDLGYIFQSLFGSVWSMLNFRIRFTWLGAYFNFSLLQVFIGTLLISLGLVLVFKIINKE